MFLFKDQETIEIPIMCKVCFKEIKFSISAEEYKKITKFPFKREHIHGDPKHKLVVYINKNLEIDNFKIKDLTETKAEEKELTREQKDLTKQLLSNIDLSDEEIGLYFRTTGRDAVSLGEIALLINKPKEECKKIADHFVEKGLFKDIPGATPHYAALPPYAALISQLQRFHNYITDLKKSAPTELNQSFSKLEAQANGVKQLRDYTDFILDLKENALTQLFDQQKDFDNVAKAISQIAEISSVITNLEQDAKGIMDDQIDDLTTQFKGISSKISNSMKHQIEDLTTQFEDISKEISDKVGSQVRGLQAQFAGIKEKISKNLEKLRLGVLQQAVDQVVEMSFADWIKNIEESLNQQLGAIEKASKDGLVKTRIGLSRQISEIEKLHEEGLINTTEMFNQLISKLREAINNTVSSISGITNSTAKSGDDVKKIFEEISEQFSKAVTMAEEKLGGISENVFGSFANLKETFSTRIIDTLNDLLGNIIDRLEISEQATNEFWEQAKRGGGAALTMKDIWFIRSIEGAKAHINDQISKAKMRILIVAPQITDIDIESVKGCKSHINIRIAANIDLSDITHKNIIEELNQYHNVSYRNRKLQNLWGINKDYEEVVVCVLSQSDFGTEIAGIGSIIEEHIKIFVPILEEAWLGAQKDVSPTLRSAVSMEITPKPSLTPKTESPILQPSMSTSPKPEVLKPLETPQPQPTISKPIEKEIKPVSIPEQVIKPEEEKQETKPIVELESLKKPVFEEPKATEIDPLQSQIDSLLNNLKNMTGHEISLSLEKIKTIITETRGYSGVLNPINLAISTLQSSGKLSESEITQLENKITFWRRKLNI
ncbi:MAG: hypothetical protein ACFFDK_07715 [Promethearchaeota archaeon]